MPPKPDLVQRKLGILSRAGWMTGTLHVPRLRLLSDAIDTAGDFLRLSDVTLPNQLGKVPFFALHRRAATFVVPMDDVKGYDINAITAAKNHFEVSCLFEQGAALVGELEILVGLRVSDYLTHRGLMPVRRCRLHGVADLPEEAKVAFPLALVNREAIIGVSELANEAAAAARLPIARSQEAAGGPRRPTPPSPAAKPKSLR